MRRECGDLRFTLPVVWLAFVRFIRNYLFYQLAPKAPGSREELGETIELLFLALAVAVFDYPNEHPGGWVSPGEVWENCDRKGRRSHVYEDLFWWLGRQTVAKKERPTWFLDRLSSLFKHRFMFC